MNKVILMGRLTRNPDTKYSQTPDPFAITKYTLAVNRRFKKEGEPDADFINIIAFRNNGEFAAKYFKKGQLIAVTGRLQIISYEDSQGNKKWITQVVVEEQHFAESKAAFEKHNTNNNQQAGQQNAPEGFYPINEDVDDDDLPF